MAFENSCGGLPAETVSVLCAKAQDIFRSSGLEAAGAYLMQVARRFLDEPEPHVCLARLYASRARNGPSEERAQQETRAIQAIKKALAIRTPPCAVTLHAVRQVLHYLAAHQTAAEFLSDWGNRHPDPAVRFQVLCWAAIALECRGKELLAEGLKDEMDRCNERAVELHKKAMELGLNLPRQQQLDSYFGESHIVRAYVATGRVDEWVSAVLALAKPGAEIPLSARVGYLCTASDVAAEAGLGADARSLAELVLQLTEGDVPAEIGWIQRVHVLGCLLRACHVCGDARGASLASERIEQLLVRCEASAAGKPNAEGSPGGAYNVAARYYLVTKDWERATVAARRAGELWDFGPSHFFLAVALWAGRRDRDGALKALRAAARDRNRSGKGACRNLAIDFHNHPAFAEVRDDPDFLEAIRIPEPA